MTEFYLQESKWLGPRTLLVCKKFWIFLIGDDLYNCISTINTMLQHTIYYNYIFETDIWIFPPFANWLIPLIAQLTPASALSTPSTVAVQQNTDIDTNFNHAHESGDFFNKTQMYF